MLNGVEIRETRRYGHWKGSGASLVLTSSEGETDRKGRVGRRQWNGWTASMHGEMTPAVTAC